MRSSRSRQDLSVASLWSSSGSSAYTLLMSAGVLLCFFFLVLLRPSNSMDTARPTQHAVKLQQPFADDESGRLLTVQAVFRHGARTPLNTKFFVDTPYTDCHNTYPGPQVELVDETGRPDPPEVLDLDMPPLPGGSCRMGQLTHVGHDMAVQLGTWLRQRYIEGPASLRLLPPSFQPQGVALRSTCIQRAMLTLQGVLSGLYPDLSGPVDVAASLEKYEYEYGKNVTCPALGPLLEELQALVARRDVNNPELKRLAGIVRQALGLTAGDQLDWVHLFDTLAAMRAEGVPLPPGAGQDILSVIAQQAVRHEAAYVGPTPQDGLLDDKTCRSIIAMSIGPLVYRLYSNMEAAVEAAEATGAAGVAGLEAGGGADEAQGQLGNHRALPKRVTGVKRGLGRTMLLEPELEGLGAGGSRTSQGASARPHPLPGTAEFDPAAVQAHARPGFGVSTQSASSAEGLEAHAMPTGIQAGGSERSRQHQQVAFTVQESQGQQAPVQPVISSQDKAQQSDSASANGQAAARQLLGSAGLGPRKGGTSSSIPPQLHMYSGHDSTITPLLVVLGQPETQWPPFTANLVFELWQRPSEARRGSHSRSAGGESGAVDVVSGGREHRSWQNSAGRKEEPGRGAGLTKAAGESDVTAEVDSRRQRGSWSKYGGRYSVRVLYNHEVMKLKYSLPGGWMDLDDFGRMIQPFSLSDTAKADACSRVPSVVHSAAGSDML